MKALISFSAPLSMNYTSVGESATYSPIQQIRHQIKKSRRRRRLWWDKMTNQEHTAEDDPG